MHGLLKVRYLKLIVILSLGDLQKLNSYKNTLKFLSFIVGIKDFAKLHFSSIVLSIKMQVTVTRLDFCRFPYFYISNYNILFSHFINVFNVWKLFSFNVSVMRSYNKKAVRVESHPYPITHGRHDDFQINVITKNQPKPKSCLEDDCNPHEYHPRKHKSSHISSNTIKQ